MREILFKAKRVNNGEWVEGWLFKTQEHSYIAYDIQFDDDLFLSPQNIFIEIDTDTICQYTGLTDKNGNKIWENDVVRYYDDLAEMEKEDLIKWNETHASFTRLHESKMGLQYLYIDECIANRCEVIGNIFDNAELLKVEER